MSGNGAETRCLICRRLLDNPADLPASKDCGGDCTACLAEVGDHDARAAMGWHDPDINAPAPRPAWLDDPQWRDND